MSEQAPDINAVCLPEGFGLDLVRFCGENAVRFTFATRDEKIGTVAFVIGPMTADDLRILIGKAAQAPGSGVAIDDWMRQFGLGEEAAK